MIGRALLLISLAASVAYLPPHAQRPDFRVERRIAAGGEGPRRLPVDLALLKDAARFERLERVLDRDGAHWRARNGLGDLRLFDGDGREIPHLLIYPGAEGPAWIDASRAPGTMRRGSPRLVEFDLGSSVLVDAVRLEGLSASSVTRATIAGSRDRSRWTTLVEDEAIVDLPHEALRQLTLTFSPGSYRYFRLSGDVASRWRGERLLARRAVSSGEPRIDAAVERRPAEPGRSRYRIQLPAGGLPVVGLVLEAAGGELSREASVTQSVFQGPHAAVPVEIGRARLTRVVRNGIAAEDLSIPITRPQDAQLGLLVEDGSDSPFDLTRVTLELAELPWIYFEAPSGSVIARFGADRAEAPRYDLESERRRIHFGEIPEARWEPARLMQREPVGSASRPQPGPAIDVEPFRYRRTLSQATGLSMVLLDAAVLAHSRGVDADFADVRIVDQQHRQVPYLLERLPEPLGVDLVTERIDPRAGELRAGASKNLSVYAVRLPYRDLPASSLVIETPERIFARRVRVGVERPPDREHRETWFDELVSADWTHRESTDQPSSLSLRLPRLEHERLVMAIEEGDNSPLPIAAARLLLPAYRLRFYHPEGPARLVYGRNDLAAPQYDFELIASRVLAAPATEVELGEEAPVGGSMDAAEREGMVSRPLFWGALLAAVLVLTGLIVKLMRTREP